MNRKASLLLLILIALFAAGCARQGRATEEMGACPEPGEATALLKNEQLGYCLLYPDNYIVEPRDSADILVIDTIMNHVDPRFDITVEDPAGRTAAEAADEWAQGWAGFEMPRSTITLDGKEAVVVNDVPGQELSRYLFVVHGDRLYRMMFTHTSPDLGETYMQAQNLYTVVTNSFHFLPGQ